ncbi:hypothetical protein HU751_020590 [Pseudomonas sp. BW13M1]|uniref:Uncharacterized protein n=1 Tax=Pseudomonas peradeniyensis TaxID=2745488 RepID=A0A923G8V1_9PSED|nr:hypothetical protein [Pseudomonas peradeniyensis]MBV4507231.1 hypothetical protein [Pseudomonas peradeniyensis]
MNTQQNGIWMHPGVKREIWPTARKVASGLPPMSNAHRAMAFLYAFFMPAFAG